MFVLEVGRVRLEFGLLGDVEICGLVVCLGIICWEYCGEIIVIWFWVVVGIMEEENFGCFIGILILWDVSWFEYGFGLVVSLNFGIRFNWGVLMEIFGEWLLRFNFCMIFLFLLGFEWLECIEELFLFDFEVRFDKCCSVVFIVFVLLWFRLCLRDGVLWMLEWWLLSLIFEWWLLWLMFEWWLLCLIFEWCLFLIFDWWLLCLIFEWWLLSLILERWLLCLIFDWWLFWLFLLFLINLERYVGGFVWVWSLGLGVLELCKFVSGGDVFWVGGEVFFEIFWGNGSEDFFGVFVIVGVIGICCFFIVVFFLELFWILGGVGGSLLVCYFIFGDLVVIIWIGNICVIRLEY